MGVVLVSHYAGEDGQRPIGQVILDILHQRRHALGVMPAVHDHQRLPPHHLEADGPAHLRQTLPHRVFVDVPAAAAQHLHYRQRCGGVIQLHPAQQRQVQIGQVTEIEGLPVQRMGERGESVHVHRVQRDAAGAASCGYDLRHRRRTGVQHRLAAGLDDAGLGGGDLLHGIAQIGHVIQTDVAQHGGLRRGDGVGGVELAAHAHLAHHDVALTPGKPCEGDGGHHLKLRGVVSHAVRQRPHLLRNGAQLLVGDGLTVHLHPLVEAKDVGRCVQPRAIPRGP